MTYPACFGYHLSSQDEPCPEAFPDGEDGETEMARRFAHRWNRVHWHRERGVARRYRSMLDPSLDARCRDELAVILDHRASEL